jgi:hypothetical protein
VNTPSAPSREEAAALGRALTRALAVTATLAGIFTAVNTTLFATRHGTPWPIAILLDPMLATGMATVLLCEARLTSWGVRPPGWSTVLRWFTSVTATVLNTWSSLWPDGRPGWPTHADIAGTVLHGVPPVLLALLAETVASYRDRVHHLIATAPPPGTDHAAHLRAPQDSDDATGGAMTVPRDENRMCGTGIEEVLPAVATGTQETNIPVHVAGPDADDHRPPPASADNGQADTTFIRPSGTDHGPNTAPPGPDTPPAPDGPPDGDTFAHAQRLDAQHRALTGRPVPVNHLRTALRIGYPKAKQLREDLNAHHATVPHTTENPPRDRQQSRTPPRPATRTPAATTPHPGTRTATHLDHKHTDEPSGNHPHPSEIVATQ